MLETLDLKTPLLFSHSSLLFGRIGLTNSSLQAPNFTSYLSQSRRIQIQSLLVSARRGRRRTRQARSQSSAKLLLNLASLVASNFHVLPRPLEFVLQELATSDGGSGGGRGNSGFWKGSGWGDFGGFGRRRSKRRNNLWLYGLAAICGLGFVFGREIQANAVWWGLGFGPLGIAAVRWWERSSGVQGWVFLGFCLWSFVVGMSFRREELQKWVSNVTVSLPMVKSLTTVRRRARRSGRRVF